jgi:integrase
MDINLETDFICVRAAGAKSAKRRLIKIRPALKGWLERCRQVAGPIWPLKSARGRILHESVRRAAGFGKPGSETEAERAAGLVLKPWPHNALRHSFATYDLALTANASALALELGHTSNALIFQHYRELVTPALAESYWSLSPERVLRNVVIPAAAPIGPDLARSSKSTVAVA